MSYPRCKGAVSVDQEVYEREAKTACSIDSNNTSGLKLNLNPDICELGIAELGSLKSFENWLTKPKIALSGRKPI